MAPVSICAGSRFDGHFVELAFAGRVGAIAIGMAGLCPARMQRWPTA